MSKDMTFEKFLERRAEKRFTAKEIKDHIKQWIPYYHCNVFDTHYNGGDTPWPRAKFWADIMAYKHKVPEYFAYIKFYTKKEVINPGDDEIYALVAGKTHLQSREILFQIDESKDWKIDEIDHTRKDKAKKWLKAQTGTYRWCYEKVMIIWKPADSRLSCKEVENLALSVEADVGGLFGLFSS